MWAFFSSLIWSFYCHLIILGILKFQDDVPDMIFNWLCREMLWIFSFWIFAFQFWDFFTCSSIYFINSKVNFPLQFNISNLVIRMHIKSMVSYNNHQSGGSNDMAVWKKNSVDTFLFDQHQRILCSMKHCKFFHLVFLILFL